MYGILMPEIMREVGKDKGIVQKRISRGMPLYDEGDRGWGLKRVRRKSGRKTSFIKKIMRRQRKGREGDKEGVMPCGVG